MHLKVLNVGAFFIQETKLYKKGQFKLDQYQVFELLRENKKGGGLAIGALKTVNPVLISEGDTDMEILVVQIKIGDIPVRLINGYGPQETDSEEQRLQFFARLDEECQKAKDDNVEVIMELDANAKLGKENINGDKHNLSANGQLLLNLASSQSLTIVNTLNICKGFIIRKRQTNKVNEESTIDYLLVSEKLVIFIENMIVDEERKHVLTTYAGKKGLKL